MKRKVIITVLIIVVACAFSMYLSADKFGTMNPISGGIGFVRIITSDTPFVMIQNEPKVFLAKPREDIVKALETYGYEYVEEERMGAMLTFKLGEERQIVEYSVNRYFARWVFQ